MTVNQQVGQNPLKGLCIGVVVDWTSVCKVGVPVVQGWCLHHVALYP